MAKLRVWLSSENSSIFVVRIISNKIFLRRSGLCNLHGILVISWKRMCIVNMHAEHASQPTIKIKIALPSSEI